MPESSETIYQDLRTKLMSASFPEGTRMKPDVLRSLYNCSASTIRENLLRLSCDGFLDFVDQKGFRVPKSSEKTLDELADLRILIEQQGIRDTLSDSNLAWEAQLTAAHHKLAHIEEQMRNLKNITDHIVIWTAAERDFHRTLVSGSGSALLKDMHNTVFDRFRQMLVLNYGQSRFGFRKDNIREHERIVKEALAGNIEECCAAVRDHVKTGMTALRDNFLEQHSST